MFRLHPFLLKITCWTFVGVSDNDTSAGKSRFMADRRTSCRVSVSPEAVLSLGDQVGKNAGGARERLPVENRP